MFCKRANSLRHGHPAKDARPKPAEGRYSGSDSFFVTRQPNPHPQTRKRSTSNREPKTVGCRLSVLFRFFRPSLLRSPLPPLAGHSPLLTAPICRSPKSNHSRTYEPFYRNSNYSHTYGIPGGWGGYWSYQCDFAETDLNVGHYNGKRAGPFGRTLDKHFDRTQGKRAQPLQRKRKRRERTQRGGATKDSSGTQPKRARPRQLGIQKTRVAGSMGTPPGHAMAGSCEPTTLFAAPAYRPGAAGATVFSCRCRGWPG